MTAVKRNALVPFSAQQMFDLVDDIEAYPQFLPWCKSASVHSRDALQVTASIEIAKAGIQQTFTTRNLNTQGEVIEMQLVDGPFQALHGYWRFQALNENACKVSLDLEFEFSSKVLSMTLGPVFSQICNTMVEVFVKRAREVYSA
ncbi:MAG: type II toxin-antitoxin system RatA family toxin [Gammaproteobacteria bacterium]|nr:type II toxin-antitoxin system RatA family toxin [Gammaproteobacteria bacterium]